MFVLPIYTAYWHISIMIQNSYSIPTLNSAVFSWNNYINMFFIITFILLQNETVFKAMNSRQPLCSAYAYSVLLRSRTHNWLLEHRLKHRLLGLPTMNKLFTLYWLMGGGAERWGKWGKQTDDLRLIPEIIIQPQGQSLLELLVWELNLLLQSSQQEVSFGISLPIWKEPLEPTVYLSLQHPYIIIL